MFALDVFEGFEDAAEERVAVVFSVEERQGPELPCCVGHVGSARAAGVLRVDADPSLFELSLNHFQTV